MHLGESSHTHLWNYFVYILFEFIHHNLLYTRGMHACVSIPTVEFFNYKIKSHRTCESAGDMQHSEYSDSVQIKIVQIF